MTGIATEPEHKDYFPSIREGRVAALLKALVEEVGLHDGSTVGSLVARVNAIETGTTGLQLAIATPAAVGTAAVGTGTKAARDDHVHAADGVAIALTGLTSANWATSAPADVKTAIDRIATLVKALNTNTAIP